VNAPGPAAEDRSRPRAALPALCATQLTNWGIVYFAFPVLNARITADTGWAATATSAAFSGALLVAALAGIPVGRVLDRRGPRAVMTTGSVLGVTAVLTMAAAPNLLVFAAAWLLAGAAMSASFYQAAFAAITRWYGSGRVRAMTTVTLAGGLASTVYAPLTAALAEHFSWRATYVVLAIVLGAVTIPLHAFGLRGDWPPAPAVEVRGGTTAVARTRPFLLLAAALGLSAFALNAAVISLVPLLTGRGAGPSAAAWALGAGGLGLVLGRTGYTALARRTSPRLRAFLLLASGGASTALLAAVPGPVPLLIALAALAGMVRGNCTLLQATAIADRWGTAAYGRLSGILAAPSSIATALAPYAGTALAGALGGYPALFAVLAALSVVAAVLAAGTSPAGTTPGSTSGAGLPPPESSAPRQHPVRKEREFPRTTA
jgi:MFS family permease